LFAEPEKPATASVVLRLYPGRSLDQRQLQGIINLVACAVQGLKTENVTIVDMAGGLLSRGHGELTAGTLSKAQFDYQRKIESSLENRIQTMLEPVIGANKVVARVSAEVDFRQVNISEEKYDPDNTAIRSEQREKESTESGTALATGSPDLKYQIAKGQTGAPASSKSLVKENAVINYEINRVNKQIISSVGDINRLTAAVIIDGPYGTEKTADGKTVTKFIPRSRRELKTFEDIIKKAIGFNSKRGDQVNVSNIPFALQKEEIQFAEIRSPWLEYIKKGAKPVFNILLIILFFILAIRPFKRWLNQTGEYVSRQALPAGDGAPKLESAYGAGDSSALKKELMGPAEKNPELAADIIRGWINEGS
jgi:flagellar M-ring protein FliF